MLLSAAKNSTLKWEKVEAAFPCGILSFTGANQKGKPLLHVESMCDLTAWYSFASI